MSTQFVKNTNAPDSSSELWTVAEGWKISAKSGKIYTNLDKVFKNEVNPESEDNDFYNALIDQLDGKVTEPIDYIGYYFVAGAYRMVLNWFTPLRKVIWMVLTNR